MDAFEPIAKNENPNKAKKEINKKFDLDITYEDNKIKDLDPELLIRTSGEYRISNFLLWQIAYSELYFSQTFWPDFKKSDFIEAIVEYQRRERRFGKIK